ncbi:MAG: LssY C-terminal domain-containing protein [Deltaproteobacteria bacterium]|jgi:membrane protein DedA with SNARE-associated domain/membrane-associated phospholipid phosphatase
MINDMIHHLLPAVAHFRVVGYWIALFAALLETTVGIGLILPGSTLILFLGAVSAGGYLDVGDLIWFAVMGAIIGDNLNYYLGKKYGARWLRGGFWLIKAQHAEKARLFMNTHGAKSVFLGRFIPSLKEVVPFIAGSVGMRRKTFLLWNAIGAIGWGFEWVLAGYIFAQSLNIARLWLSRAGLVLVLILILGCTVYFFKWLIIKKGKLFLSVADSLWQPVKNAALNNRRVAGWVQKHPQSISFLKSRMDPSTFSGLPLSMLTVAFVYALILFGGVVEDLITSDSIVVVDIRVANLLAAFRTRALTDIFTWITLLGKLQIVSAFIAVTIALLWLWRKRACTPALFVSVIGSETFTYLSKLAFHRPRPQLAVYAEYSFSFPSGHATIAVAFYGFITYLLIRSAASWKRKVNLFFAGILIILAIGLSRIYLAEHYLSDVWGGYLVGAIWLIVAISLSEWFESKNAKEAPSVFSAVALPFSWGMVLAAVVFYAAYGVYYHPIPASLPAKKEVVVSRPINIFANERLKYTETLTGEKQEPVNLLLIAKNDLHIAAAFTGAGWNTPDKAGMSSFIRVVKAVVFKKPYPLAPISPSFWNSSIQDFNFTKPIDVNRFGDAHHLRIWRTNSLLESGRHIYVGMANAVDGVNWWGIPTISPDLDAARAFVFRNLKQSGEIEGYYKIHLVKPEIGENFLGSRFFADGKAYIISLK